jgi:predicted transcriptional regulator
MRTYKFGSLPVLRGDRLIGIVTTSNILTSYMALLARLEE